MSSNLPKKWGGGELKVRGTNGGSPSGILPSLTHGNCIFGPKSNMGRSVAVEQLLNEPPFVRGTVFASRPLKSAIIRPDIHRD